MNHNVDYFSHKRRLKELLHLKDDDDAGYIEGKVFMMWPPRNGLHRVNLEVVEDSTPHRFELEVPHKDGVTFRPHERFFISLKGARVDHRKESSSPHYFPIVLRFPEGVVLKYLSGANAGKVVNTWVDEWYNPGTFRTVSDAVTIDASKHHSSTLAVTCPIISPSQNSVTGRRLDCVDPPPAVAITDDAATAQSMQPTKRPSIERSSRCRARERKKRKLNKLKETALSNKLADETDGSRLANTTTPSHEQPQISNPGSLTIAPVEACGTGCGEAAIQTESCILRSHANLHIDAMPVPDEAILSPKAGVRTERGDIFSPLCDLQNGQSMINVIGIVTSVTAEKKTRTDAWSRSFTLVDPSTVSLPRQSIRVNCFQTKYVEWLPQVEKNDVIILRKLKISEFQGAITATGYADKLRWGVYDPLKHSIRPPNKGNAPDKELIADGMGYEFSPYWEPFQDSVELDYCREIGEWWKARHPLEGQQISTSTVVCPEPFRKQHLLISQVSPDLPFFNCTVEVLQKFNNHGGATIVYVTDYTSNAFLYSMQAAAWCPPELSDCVLQCSMWDDARNIAQMMNPGEYWYLHNVRAKWNPSHCMEGKMNEADKVALLDETKLEVLPNLRALLARKKNFELTKSDLGLRSPSPHIFPDILLQDLEGDTMFSTCIVELLHVDLNTRDGHFLYVTDYTYNPDLPTSVSAAEWAHNLGHRVLKIKLDDPQAKMALGHRPNSIYIIHNVRIKHSGASGSIYGSLGGEDTHITLLQDLSSHRAQTLQGNKEKWTRENKLNVPTTTTDASFRQSLINLNDTTLQQVVAKPAPSIFRVTARAIDYFPFSLEDASALRCTKCDMSPPPSFKQCPRCDDMMETHTKWFYRFYILLQDEEGSELTVSLSGKECRLLQEVDPTDFHCDRATFSRFLGKIDPILGNLRDVHMAWARNEDKVVDSPLMIFTIESWNIGSERGYSLLDCN